MTNQKIEKIKERAARATPGPLELMRYDHGGGRLGHFGKTSTERKLVADFFHEEDREFYYHALADIPYLLARLDQFREVLAEHHKWHLASGLIGLPDGNGGWIEIDNCDAYSDSSMCDRTMKALEGGEDADPDSVRDRRQRTIGNWCREAFGQLQAGSLPQRGLRLAEEAIEAAQACDTPAELLHQLIDHVYKKAPDPLPRELGGVAVTLLALAEAAGLSADECETREIDRVLSKPIDVFKQRNRAKNALGFNAAGGD